MNRKSSDTSGRLARLHQLRRDRTKRAGRFYGKLTAKDYGALLRDLREARSSRSQLAAEATRKGGKLASLLDSEGMYWWRFYDLEFRHHLALLCLEMGWAERLKEVAAADNPPRAFLEFATREDEDEAQFFSSRTRTEQASMVNLLIGIFYSIDAIRYFGLSINELLHKARLGDREALLRAASVDRCVLITSSGADVVAGAQLRRDRLFFSSLAKRMKAPHSSREVYGDLRYFRRVLDEAGALASCSGDELLDLVGDELQLYSTSSGDPVKGLLDRFRDWKVDATR